MVAVKICGITNSDDAWAAVEAGTDLLGFVFYPPSPRYVTPDQARAIISELRRGEQARTARKVRTAGVFVNMPLEQIQAVMEHATLDLAQLHGTEPPTLVQALGARAYKALQAHNLDTARHLMANYRAAVCDPPRLANMPSFIADAPPARLPGGNGLTADWAVARAIAAEFPVLLAGGLDLENVREAIERVKPWGVDVSSGVEQAPGLKDHSKVREFIRRIREH